MSVLQRKAQVGKQEHQARAMTVPKALRVGLAKVADETFDMALAVIGLTQEQVANDALDELFDDSALLLLLDGPTGLSGGAVMDTTLVAAMVQQQTMGRVVQLTDTDRRMTSTDAALCAPLIEGVLARANSLLEDPDDRDLIARFRYGARAENARLFSLALEATQFTALNLTVDVAAGKGQANLKLILPVPEPGHDLHTIDTDEEPCVKAPVTIEKTAMGLQAELSAVLCRMTLPLSEISRFEAGSILPVRSGAFDEMELVAIDGRVMAKGVMGQIEGKRALMLEADERRAADAAESPEEAASDYGNLELPALELPADLPPIDPSNLDSLPDLPELPDLSDAIEDALPATSDNPAFPDLPDLDGLPDLEDLPDLGGDGLADLPDLDTELPDLPKINVA